MADTADDVRTPREAILAGRPFNDQEIDALQDLVRRARHFAATADEFWRDHPEALDEPLQHLDEALERFYRASARACGREPKTREELLEAKCQELAELGAQVADQHRAFLTLAARSTPGLNELALNALTATVPKEGTRAEEIAQHWAAKSLAMDLLRSLGDAPNYVTMNLVTPSGDIEVTIRRAEGKTPAQVIRELNETIARLTRERDDALDQAAHATADARAAESR